jgi:hypothetical protein
MTETERQAEYEARLKQQIKDADSLRAMAHNIGVLARDLQSQIECLRPVRESNQSARELIMDVHLFLVHCDRYSREWGL